MQYSNPYIFHFTKPYDDSRGAAGRLVDILRSGVLKADSVPWSIRQEAVVCFLDYPLTECALSYKYGGPGGFLKGRYSPYGLAFSKADLFRLGARHVIYQPDEDGRLLAPEHTFLHTKFDLDDTPTIDFTWEKEWRIKENLTLDGLVKFIVIPRLSEKRWFNHRLGGGFEVVALDTLG